MFRRKKNPSEPSAEVPLGDDLLVVVDQSVSPFLVVFHDPAGFRAEQFRSVRNKLLTMNPDGSPRVLVITSAIKGEGKTITAINLAMTFAEMERTAVLLVDGDLRGPAIEEYLNLNPHPGLADVLLGRIGLERAVRDSGFRNLQLLGAGMRLAGPSELLTGPRIEELFARLKESYQYVIVDTPPTLPVTDASMLAARADGCLLVVRLEHSPKTLAKDALRTLQDLGGNVLGTFVTEVRGADPDANPRLAYTRRDEGEA
jgi:capsular exopolysaccharide synthesis family protein